MDRWCTFVDYTTGPIFRNRPVPEYLPETRQLPVSRPISHVIDIKNITLTEPRFSYKEYRKHDIWERGRYKTTAYFNTAIYKELRDFIVKEYF